ncbi:hypothetical protein N9L68_06395 [bacterium]|nr:hypothetical protein [bacterium]
MLLGVQATDDQVNGMLYYAADMPSGVAQNIIHLLRLGHAMMDPKNRDLLLDMQAPDEQSAHEWVALLIKLLDQIGQRADEAFAVSLARQQRSGSIAAPRVLRPIVRGRVCAAEWQGRGGVTIQEGQVGESFQYYSTRHIPTEQWQGRISSRGGESSPS